MRINTTKENLLNGVQMVQRAVSTKNPMPILTGILLESKDNKLKLTATDLEIGIECNVEVTTIEEGSIIVPAKYITEIVRKLPDVPIDLTGDTENNTITIQYNSSQVNLHGFNADEYPAFPVVEGNLSFAIPTNTFKETLRQVLYATNTDESRPVFTGVLFEIKDGLLTLVATDTHRLALKKVAIDEEPAELETIIPGRTLGEISRIISNSDDEDVIKITLGSNQALFTIKNTVIVSRLIEGQFPNYQGVIPKNHKSKVRIKVKELLDSTERAALLTKTGRETIRLDIKKDLLMLSANTDVGFIQENLNCYLEGEEVSISFNARYLTDVLRTVGEEEIILELSGPLSPGVIRPPRGDNYLSLILPVRTA
ncbi:DNA polymerase III subunit beta [Desulfofalx alkaliphila]|uniref:DNA polymerase III subunit beta n=1 Tax=Desulfofalx alkaliphila TaxID=105483 RepID=UPI0004E1AB8B|nr:DNA polymerase III subunit beta [Desulfofalx alkaliphila]